MTGDETAKELNKHLIDCAGYRGAVARKLDRLTWLVYAALFLKGFDLAGGVDFVKAAMT